MLTLTAATIAIAYESNLFVQVVESVTERWGLSDVFTGVILLPLLGGAAEYVTSVSMARRNKMDLAVSVVLSSTLLIALLVVPVLVLAGPFLGHALDLNFGIYEVVAVTFSVVVSPIHPSVPFSVIVSSSVSVSLVPPTTLTSTTPTTTITDPYPIHPIETAKKRCSRSVPCHQNQIQQILNIYFILFTSKNQKITTTLLKTK